MIWVSFLAKPLIFNFYVLNVAFCKSSDLSALQLHPLQRGESNSMYKAVLELCFQS